MASNGVIGKPTWIVLAFGAGAAWIAWNWKDGASHTAAAKVAPARTVVIHETVTRVVHAAAHSPVSGTDIVLIAIAALVVFLVLALNGRA